MIYIKQDGVERTWITSDVGFMSHAQRSSLKMKIVTELKEVGIRAYVLWSYKGKYFTIKFMSEADEAYFTLRYNDRILTINYVS